MTSAAEGGWTRLHSLCFKRESYGRETYFWRAETLIAKYGVDCRTNMGNTPLHLACSHTEFADFAFFLLSEGADPMARNLDGETPLHFASIHSTPSLVEALVRCTAVDVNVQDYSETTPIHWALQQSQFPVGIMRALLGAGARVDVRDDVGDTALHYAAREGLFDIFELLRAAHQGPEPYNSFGMNPFHAACETDQAEFVKRFIAKYPLEARQCTTETLATGLHLAVQAQALDTVAVLLESEAGMAQLDALDVNAKTPFVWALFMELDEIMEMLEDAGAHCDAVANVHLPLRRLATAGDSDSDSSDDWEWSTDSWSAVSPRHGHAIACTSTSDLSHRSPSEGSEQCLNIPPRRPRYTPLFAADICHGDPASCP